MTPSGPKACPVCQGVDLRSVVEMERIPVFANVLWDSRDDARGAPRGRMELVHCPTCNHLFNSAFDPALTEYSPVYENSLHHSGVFTEYVEELAQGLVERYDLREKDIVEMGCGDGEFLTLLCGLGSNRGVGFDRSLPDEPKTIASPERVQFVNEFLTPQTPPLPVDFLCCRHVLEHIPDPLPFLKGIRGWLGSHHQAAFYFEVPNARWTLEEGGIWDLIYEHPSYFTEESLVSLLRKGGFLPESWGESFGGQYLYVMGETSSECPPGDPGPTMDPDRMETSVGALAKQLQEEMGRWRQRFEAGRVSQETMVLWGGGSKGVSFLNLLDPGDVVSCVVDINPLKQGRFVAGTGHPIRSPQELALAAPDTVLVTNPLYLGEIRAELRRLGVDAVVEPVWEGTNEG